MQTFTITENHLKLLRRMYTSWYRCEFGAPSIDPKRPYGNSDVYGDIAEIIGIPAPNRDEDEDWTREQVEQMDTIHKEMQTVLQIVLRQASIAMGEYVSNNYGEWSSLIA